MYGALSHLDMNLYPYVSARRDVCDAAWLDENGGDTAEHQRGVRNSGPRLLSQYLYFCTSKQILLY